MRRIILWFFTVLALLSATSRAYRSNGVLWWESESGRNRFCLRMVVDCENDVLATFSAACAGCDFGARSLRLRPGDELCLRLSFSSGEMEALLNGTAAWTVPAARPCFLCVARTFE